MKLLHSAIVACVGVLALASCKKENSSNNNSSSARPKTYTENITSSFLGNSVTTYNLTYDVNNRLVSLISASDPGFKFLYQYGSNNSFTMDLYNNNMVNIHEIFWIGSNEFVDSTFQYNDTGDTTTEKYLYNSNKQLLTKKDYVYSSSGSVLDNVTTYTYDNNGNSISETDNNGTTTTEYYTDLLNPNPLGSIYYPTTKYLPKTLTYSSGGSSETLTHTYTFDGNHRLITDKQVISNGDVYINTYTY